MRNSDWSATALGPIDNWTIGLRHAVGVCVASPLATYLWWGTNLTLLYNDAAIRFLPLGRHPAVLGRPGRETWMDLWDTLGPAIENVLRTGDGCTARDVALFLARGLPSEEAHATFSFCPLIEGDRVAGVLGTCVETTNEFLSNRRLDTLKRLATRPSGALPPARVAMDVMAVLETNPDDVPLAAIYLRGDGRRGVRLMAGTTLEHGARFPDVIFDPGNNVPAVSTLGAIWHGNAVTEIPDFDVFMAEARSRSGARVRRGLALPLHLDRGGEPAGALVVGLSPHLALDENYRSFLEMIARQIGATLGEAGAGESRHRQDALRALERTKAEVIHRVSDEFRTPLALVLGTLEAEMNESPSSRDRLEPARRNALRLLRLINALLDFSGADTKQLEASFQPTDLAALTAELTSVFTPVVERGGLRLVVDCPPLPERVFVDRELWEKIVLNLLSNAFKFTFEGEIRVTLRARPGNAQLVVADTGVGIPEEQLPRVFDRFQRENRRRARTFEGAGVGLALVRELTRLHRGTVTVESVEGHGATFTVTIPLGSDHLPKDRLREPSGLPAITLTAEAYVLEALRWLPENGALTTASGNPWGDGPSGRSTEGVVKSRILLVDAHPDMRDYVSHLLGSRYQVEVVPTGEEALPAIRSRPPDVVLVDVVLPQLDGFELLRTLRDHPRTRTLPVILISARTGDDARLEALEAGADDYVLKPFSTRELLARIEATLALARTRGEAHEREQELHARIVDILESMTDGFMAVDRDWRVTYINAAAEKMLQLEREVVLGGSLWELFGDTWGVAMERAYRRAMTRRVPEKVEIYDQPADRWYEQEAYPIHAGGLAFYVRDLTARKQTERALGDSEAKFRTLADATSAIIWFVDEDVQSRYVNRRCLEYFGRTEREMLDTSWELLAHPEDAPAFLAQLRDAVCERRRLRARCRMRRHDGQWRVVESQALPHFSENGHYLGHVGHSVDITEMLAVSVALRESEERLRIATEAAHIYTWDVDAVTGAVRRSANAPHLLGFGRLASDEGLLDSVYPEDRDMVAAAFASCTREGGRLRVDYRVQPAGHDEIVWVRAEGIVLEGGGGSRRIIGIAQNITEAKRAELNAAFLAEINGEFARLTSSEEIMRAVGDRALRHFGVTRLTFAEIKEAADEVTPVYDSHEPGAEGTRTTRRIREFASDRLLADVKAGDVVAVNDIDVDPRTAEFAAAYRPFQIRAMLIAPLFTEGQWKFALCAQRRNAHAWRPDEIALLRELAAWVYPRLERARAEEALRDSQQQLNLIVETVPVSILHLDRELRIKLANSVYLRRIGKDAREVVGRTLGEAVGEENYRKIRPHLERALAGEHVKYEVRVLYPEIGDRDLQVQYSPQLGPDGAVAGIVAAIEDITERKSSERTLQARARRASFLAELADLLREAGDRDLPATKAIELLAAHLDADRVVYAEADAAQLRAKIVAQWPKPATTSGASPRADDHLEVATEYRHGRPRRLVRPTPPTPPENKSGTPDAELGVPIMAGDRLLALIELHRASAKSWSNDDVELVREVGERIGAAIERMNTEKRLRESDERQRAEGARQDLLRQLVNAQEDERRRISRELHDDIGQHLTALMLGLKSLEGAQGSEKARETVKALQDITERVGRETHELALELRPTALDDLGLVRTLANYTEQWSARFGIAVEYHSSAWSGPRLPSHMETALYRIVQEALTNVIRHAQAHRVSLIVERRPDRAVVIIEDDGDGFDPEASRDAEKPQRLGLLGMRERAALLGGELTVESSPGKGTAIFVRIPVPEA